MKILNTTQTREADQYTISHEPISPINLMERASRAFTDRLLHEIKPISPVNIFAGKGNNGGDALAVARMLHQAGYEVIIWIINFGKATQEFETNLKRALQNELKINYIE